MPSLSRVRARVIGVLSCSARAAYEPLSWGIKYTVFCPNPNPNPNLSGMLRVTDCVTLTLTLSGFTHRTDHLHIIPLCRYFRADIDLAHVAGWNRIPCKI